MRSGSSLLMHLLVSHEELLGIGERNVVFQKPRDLSKLELISRWKYRQLFSNQKYFVDQINHNKFTPYHSLWNEYPIQIIFLVRNPSESISSLLNLSKQHYNDKWSLEMAENYYTNRLLGMQQIYDSITVKTSALCIQYEELISDPEKELVRIQSFLALKNSIKSSYELFDFSRKSGDPSAQILEGKIIKTNKNLHKIPADSLEKMNSIRARFIQNFDQ